MPQHIQVVLPCITAVQKHLPCILISIQYPALFLDSHVPACFQIPQNMSHSVGGFFGKLGKIRLRKASRFPHDFKDAAKHGAIVQHLKNMPIACRIDFILISSKILCHINHHPDIHSRSDEMPDHVECQKNQVVRISQGPVYFTIP